MAMRWISPVFTLNDVTVPHRFRYRSALKEGVHHRRFFGLVSPQSASRNLQSP
jgi:hypothetical protein